MSFTYADPSVLTFVVLPLLLVAWLLWAVRFTWHASGVRGPRVTRSVALTGIVAAAWLGLTWIVAARGILTQWDWVPPPLVPLVAAIFTLAGVLAFGPHGRRLTEHMPLRRLVGLQTFRFPLELAMHGLAGTGVMPAQMSYGAGGLNYDIVTGITAVVVATLLANGRAPRWLVWVWNVMGFALLTNIVAIAIASTPIFARFGPDRLNVFVAHPPFVWLPAVMVLAALTGHLLIFRALLRRP
jgi:hypothetical protein